MQKLKRYALPAVCIVLSVLVTHWSITFGTDRALAGEEALIWAHIFLFFVAVGLVLAAILLHAKLKK